MVNNNLLVMELLYSIHLQSEGKVIGTKEVWLSLSTLYSNNKKNNMLVKVMMMTFACIKIFQIVLLNIQTKVSLLALCNKQ